MTDLHACVDFIQRLIRTESLPGNESTIAELMRAEMESLGYADVHLDEAGNVLGRVRGAGVAPPMMFNTHLDHVDVGEYDAWPHPPFGAEIHGEAIWGRGAVDIKGPLACQVYGVARLLKNVERPPGDIWVTGTVQEEVGGLGARHMSSYIETPLAVIGEPSGCTLRRGHRGRTELIVHARGRSVHASVPHEGVNALEPIARFISSLGELKMRDDPDLGPSTVVPSLIRTDQTSANVVPGEVWLTCDWRNVPGESGEDARGALQAVADRVLAELTGNVATDPVTGNDCKRVPELKVMIVSYERISHAGLIMNYPADNPAYIVRGDHPVFVAAQAALSSVLARDVPIDVWQFATDGGHFALGGVTCLGFGPGNELLAHTVNESIGINEVADALNGNEALAHVLDARLTI